MLRGVLGDYLGSVHPLTEAQCPIGVWAQEHRDRCSLQRPCHSSDSGFAHLGTWEEGR